MRLRGATLVPSAGAGRDPRRVRFDWPARNTNAWSMSVPTWPGVRTEAALITAGAPEETGKARRLSSSWWSFRPGRLSGRSKGRRLGGDMGGTLSSRRPSTSLSVGS